MSLLRASGVALVIADGPKVRSFQRHELTAGFAYVRLHAGARGRRGNYSQTELGTGRSGSRPGRRNGDVFVYLNNDWEGFAPANTARPYDRTERRECDCAHFVSAAGHVLGVAQRLRAAASTEGSCRRRSRARSPPSRC